ncbi:peptidoglycan-binding domain-containing protein [Streptomyces sp. NBC_00212]|uniref:peptidoglycan-binding domain-containing protein n=1 Tax=Streptomyces sp. NBC_00212 TaxID=2975684 RepID=UPI002F913AEE
MCSPTAGTASAQQGVAKIGYGPTTSGAGVWCVQHNLNFFIRSGKISSAPPYGILDEDSQWGAKTEATVKWFQQDLGASPDGVVGPQTGSLFLDNEPPCVPRTVALRGFYAAACNSSYSACTSAGVR